MIKTGKYSPADACLADYVPYRMLLAVDRGRLPEAGRLPTADATIDGKIIDGRVGAYPDDALTDG